MNILMMTNTYLPLVGGLERSIESFVKEYRKRGHRAVIVAPEFENRPENELDVIRVPALQKVSGSKYSVKLPIEGHLSDVLSGFKPDIIHAHHPFLMGDTALRLAYEHKVPLVFTHHSLYEKNVGHSEMVQRFVTEIATGYANCCSHVIAPSKSVAELIKARGVETPVTVISTGLDLSQYKGTDGNFREQAKLPKEAFVIGYVGRLAPEKNLLFLNRAVASFLISEKKSVFLVVGSGPSKEDLLNYFKERKLEGRLFLVGELKGKRLIEAFQSIDVFAFSSHSETQGMVLNEAMAAGVPVVGLDAPGVRDIVKDKINGRLVPDECEQDFADALSWIYRQSAAGRRKLKAEARTTAERYSMPVCVDKVLRLYESLRSPDGVPKKFEEKSILSFMQRGEAEWDLLCNVTRATIDAFTPKGTELPEEALVNN
ncbi:MAG: glycosyltransferase [Candidatus Omnitrophica bacterium]|nr:glycosyltransferase [Candidatus Omnitrophota bacterium]